MITTRTLGGYIVAPTAVMLRRTINQPRLRARALRETIAAVKRALADLEEELDDTGLELRSRYRLPWQATAAHMGMSTQNAYRRVYAHRARLDLKEEDLPGPAEDDVGEQPAAA